MENSAQTPRQKKIATLLQKEIATLLQGAIREEGVSNLLISVTKVNVTIDLSLARIYLSIFPSQKADEKIKTIQSNSFQLKHDLAQLLKNQMRKTPELTFFLDDSLDYIEKIDEALKSKENPIKTP